MVVRRTRRIGLIGGECSGKSTLAADLGSSLPACVVDEHLRDFVEENGRNPLEHEQRSVMLAQQAAEDAAAQSCPVDVLVADSAPLMIAVYSVVYFSDTSLIDSAVDLARGYDLVVWCDIDLPWVRDGILRDGPQFRRAEHELIAEIVAERLVPLGIDVIVASGSQSARAEAVGRAWRLLGQQGPT